MTPGDFKSIQATLALVQGEMAGLKIFCSALVASHPNPIALQQHFEVLSEHMTASSLPHPDMPDLALDGLQNLVKILREHIALHAARTGKASA